MSQNTTDEIERHVLRRFEICQRLGRGAYGVVWKAKEKRTQTVVALKKCFDAFRNNTDAQRTFREIMYLQALSGHDNLIRLLHVIRAENDRDVYLTFQHMETDLHAVIRAHILEDIHKKYIIYQLLRALKYLHSADLLHRDIKPSNLLLNSDCHLRLCDFGLCRSVSESGGPSPVLTDYVATRWYRAPEILLAATIYTKAVDMWSVGCILGEMITERPIFPGSSTMNQVEKILEVTGRPNQQEVESICSSYAGTMLASVTPKQQVSLEQLFPNVSQDATDFIGQNLKFSPDERCSAEAALRHPYVAEFHDPEQEPVHPGGAVRIPIDDNMKLTAADYRNRLYEEITERRREARRREQARAKRTQVAGEGEDRLTSWTQEGYEETVQA
uniref:Mitogen-activated protein kinase n=1 Tax=Phaeomonas parva TaxID=124430 RepID=A0A7S1U658_9STRA|mmetsp:Transcript_3094/g.8787  ORF Transcript_3094/g.8787 Transcript_3094/m.8787 type:complete len:387 (+) Transcript_3094:257-1417(+)